MVLIVKDTINSLHFMNERTEAQNFPVRMGLRFPPRLSGLSLPPPKTCPGRKGGKASSVALGRGSHSSTSSSVGTQREVCHPGSPTAASPEARLCSHDDVLSELGLGSSCTTGSSEGKPQTTARTLANSGLPEGKARTSIHTSCPGRPLQWKCHPSSFLGRDLLSATPSC